MGIDCAYDDDGCIVCPELPVVASVPGHIVSVPYLGWTGGANTVAQIGGDLHVVYKATPNPVGVVVGFKTTRDYNTEPTRVLHGFYHTTLHGLDYYQVYERGAALTLATVYAAGTEFEIRREGTSITYLVAGSVVATSTARSMAPFVVNACLYASNDGVQSDFTFEALTSIDVSGSLVIRLPRLRVYLSDASIGSDLVVRLPRLRVGGDLGADLRITLPRLRFVLNAALLTGDLVVRLPRLSAYLSDTRIVPDVYALYIALPTGVSLTGTESTVADLTVTLPKLRTWLTPYTEVLTVRLPKLQTRIYDNPPILTSYILAAQNPGFLYAETGLTSLLLNDSIVLASQFSTQLAKIIVDMLVCSDSVLGPSVRSAAIVDSVVFNDVVNMVWELVLNSTLVMTDNLQAARSMLLAAVDILVASDVVTNSYSGSAIISTLLTFASTAGTIAYASMADVVAMIESTTAQRAAIAAWLDELTLADTATVSLHAVALLDDTLSFTTALQALLTGQVDIFDSLAFRGQLRLAGEEYDAYAVTLGNAAVSRFTNYPFNSFAVIGGRSYGASDGGVYLLDEGTDDDGTPIDASVRMGLSNLGTPNRKTVPAGYVGYTTTGELVMKVTTTDDHGGARRESWYRIAGVARSNTSDNRFTPAAGLQSVYWGFELASIDGASFELDELRILPLVFNRRKK